MPNLRLLCVRLGPLLCGALVLCAGTMASGAEQTVRVRVAWGEGEPRAWQGGIEIAGGQARDLIPLSTDPRSNGAVQLAPHGVQITQAEAVTQNAFDVTLVGEPDAQLSIRLSDRPDAPPILRKLGELLTTPVDEALDDRGNRLIIQRNPNDAIRLAHEYQELIFTPQAQLKFTATFAAPDIQPGTAVDLTLELLRGRNGEAVWSSGEQRLAVPVDALPQYAAEIPLPADEGVYTVRIRIAQPAGFVPEFLRRNGPAAIAERTFSVVVLSDQPSVGRLTVGQPVLQIDPATPRWWERLPKWANVARLPKLSPGPRGSGPAKIVDGGVVELPERTAAGKAAWQAYPLPLAQAGKPYVVELELPRGADAVGVALYDVDARGESVPLGAGALFAPTSEVRGDTNAPRRVQKLFWPTTTSPLLVVTNAQAVGAAQFGKIRVLAVEPAESAAPLATQRLVALDLANRDLAAAFAASRASASAGYLYDDWQTAWEIAQRIAETVELAGHNGAIVSLAGPAGAAYPSTVLASGERADNSAWAAGVVDAGRKDFLRLLLAQFDRRGLRLVPHVRLQPGLNVTLAADAPAFGEVKTKLWRRALDELQQRCAGHSSVSSLAVSLELPKSSADRPQLLKFYQSLAQKPQSSSRLRLLLMTSHLLSDPQLAGALRVQPEQRLNWRMVLETQGASLADLAALANLQVCEPLLVAAAAPLSQAALAASLEIPHSTKAARIHALSSPALGNPALGTVTPTFDLDLADPTAAPLARQPHPPSQARMVLADGEVAAQQMLAIVDRNPALIFSGGEPSLAIDPAAIAFRRQLAAIPKDAESQLTHQDPVVVRTFTHPNGSAIVAVNSSPWKVESAVTVNVMQACQSQMLAEASGDALESWQPGQHALELPLTPHQAIVKAFDRPGVSTTGVRVKLPPTALEELRTALTTLEHRDLNSPHAFESVVDPSFESPQALTEWTLPADSSDAQRKLATDQPFDGQNYLQFQSSVAKTTLLSRTFAAPVTGQLAMVFRLRVLDASPEAKLTLHLQTPDGSYHQFTSTPLTAAGSEWRDLVFQVDDLPLENNGGLQVAYELTGAATIGIDRLEMFDLLAPLPFDSADATRRKLAFIQQLRGAQNAIDEGRYRDCLAALDSYTLRFYGAYAPERVEQPVLDPAPLPPPPVEEKLEFSERVRRYLPSFLR
jgi:hypothetical protein